MTPTDRAEALIAAAFTAPPKEATPAGVREVVVVQKFDKTTETRSNDELRPFETVLIVDGVVSVLTPHPQEG